MKKYFLHYYALFLWHLIGHKLMLKTNLSATIVLLILLLGRNQILILNHMMKLFLLYHGTIMILLTSHLNLMKGMPGFQ